MLLFTLEVSLGIVTRHCCSCVCSAVHLDGVSQDLHGGSIPFPGQEDRGWKLGGAAHPDRNGVLLPFVVATNTQFPPSIQFHWVSRHDASDHAALPHCAGCYAVFCRKTIFPAVMPSLLLLDIA